MAKLTAKKQLEFDVLYTPLIGQKIEIVKAKIANQVGTKGIIVHETAKFLILDVQGQIKRYFKESISFKMMFQSKALYIDARFLLSTLQTRLKKLK